MDKVTDLLSKDTANLQRILYSNSNVTILPNMNKKVERSATLTKVNLNLPRIRTKKAMSTSTSTTPRLSNTSKSNLRNLIR